MNAMTMRRRLLILLILLVGLNVFLAVMTVCGVRECVRLGDSLRTAEQVRTSVLLQAIHVADLVRARQDDEQVREEEVTQLLHASLKHTTASFDSLTKREGGGPLLATQDPALRDKHHYFDELWTLFRDAVEAVLEGRSVLRNRDFVFGNAIELANRMTDVVSVYQRSYLRRLATMRWVLWGFVAGVAVLTAAGGWMLHRKFLSPFYAVTEQMKLMGNGDLPLEAPMPYQEEDDEFGEFCRYLNLLLDRLRRADETKDRFLATMSHEIRTPMNGVIGFLQNLEETELNEQQRQYVRVIGSSARALLRVINEILDFSKLSAGKMTLEMVAFDLGKLVQEPVAVTRQMVRGKNVRIRLEMTPDQSTVIRGDPTRLRQVLDNLLNNAAKFTERGEIGLSITVEPLGEDRIAALFVVSDTGVGIASTEQQRLFEAFAQAETTTTRKFGGTGLGLCIAANLVSLMGGQLRVESQPGEGSRFSFRIETTTARPEEQVQLSEHYTITLPRGALKRFWALLVDDTPTNLFLMETICQGIGLPYMTAVNGKEAVEKVGKTHFDLIFMDIQMPVMDGYTAIREIRKIEDAATTQIIALTASAMQEDVERALGVGSTGFLAKPFERNQLLLCIAEHLGISADRELRPMPDTSETREEIAVRQMYDFMRDQYQISLGEIKLILAQSVADWRPQLDDILVFSKKGNWDAIRPVMHRFKGQLGAIGLPTFAERADEVNLKIKNDDVAELAALLETFVYELGAIFRSVEADITLAQRTVPGADDRQALIG